MSTSRRSFNVPFTGTLGPNRTRMIQSIVAQCVAGVTSMELTSDTNTNTEACVLQRQNLKTLEKYFSNPETTDIVFVQLVSRAEQHKTNPVVLLKCAQLIKDNLTLYALSTPVLIRIHQFCTVMLTRQDSRLQHSLLNNLLSFISSTIVQQARSITSAVDKSDWEVHYKNSIRRSTFSVLSSLSMDEDPIPRDLLMRRIRNMKLNLIQPSPTEHFRPPPKEEPRTGPIKTVLDSVFFGGQFRKFTRFEDKQPEIDLSSGVILTNIHKTKEQIRSIAALRRKNQNLLRQESQWEKFLPTKFDQEDDEFTPLDLKTAEEGIQRVLDHVMDPNDSDVQMDATRILIRMLAQIYIKEEEQAPNAVKQAISFLMEMIESRYPEVRAHTFALLYNLQLHLERATMMRMQSELSDTFIQQESRMNRYKEDLYDKLCTLSLRLYLNDEQDDEVWLACHKCFIGLLPLPDTPVRQSNDSQIEPTYGASLRRLAKMDIRVISKFVTIFSPLTSDFDQNMHRLLISFLTNSLYCDASTQLTPEKQIHTPPATDDTKTEPLSLRVRRNRRRAFINVDVQLNLERLGKIGGISFILDQYVITHSHESLHNLFVILFDFLVILMKRKKRLDLAYDQASALLEVLDTGRAPLYMQQLFKYVPNHRKFLKLFTKTVVIDLFVKQRSLSMQTKSIIDQSIIFTFINEMYECAAQYLHMEREFAGICTAMMSQSGSNVNEEILALIRQLCQSESADERKNGAGMLFSMFKHLDESLNTKLGSLGVKSPIPSAYQSALRESLDDLMIELSSNEGPINTRIAHMDIIEQLLYMLRSRFQNHGDADKLRPLIKLLNDSLLRYVSNKERDTIVLLRMFYLIMDFLSIYHHKPSDTDFEEDDDGLCGQFLAGRLFVPHSLLRDVSISILHHIFITLTKRANRIRDRDAHIANVRVVLLILIIEKCKNQSVLDSIGGMTFFASLLREDQEPAIAYHAAQYYMRQVSQMFPDQYYAYLERLIAEAQRSDNPLLLQNPYLQFSGLLE